MARGWMADTAIGIPPEPISTHPPTMVAALVQVTRPIIIRIPAITAPPSIQIPAGTLQIIAPIQIGIEQERSEPLRDSSMHESFKVGSIDRRHR
jgi:hypothetical protein